MSLQRITESLAVLFATHPIVFWHDSEGEFSSTVDNLALDNVNLVRLDETPALQIKIDAGSRYFCERFFRASC